MICKVCRGFSAIFSKALILGKYEIKYFKCPDCGFIQTEEPFWPDEAYSCRAVAEDVGLLSRNIFHSKVTKSIICFFFDKKGMFLDYGGGFGIFVRMMRDKGFDFYRFDKYCENLFAIHFDINAEDVADIELVTAFEVFEHFASPADELDNLVKYSPNILFTTELIPASIPKPGEWRYYGLNHGQHISFFTLRSLKEMARKQGLNFYSDGSFIHLFSRKKISRKIFKMLCRPLISTLVNNLLPGNSLLEEDFRLISGMH
jgi:hypothetical protein